MSLILAAIGAEKEASEQTPHSSFRSISFFKEKGS